MVKAHRVQTASSHPKQHVHAGDLSQAGARSNPVVKQDSLQLPPYLPFQGGGREAYDAYLEDFRKKTQQRVAAFAALVEEVEKKCGVQAKEESPKRKKHGGQGSSGFVSAAPETSSKQADTAYQGAGMPRARTRRRPIKSVLR